MNKQQFLAMSLPYGLKVTLNQKGKFNLDEDYPQPHDEVCSVVNVIIGKPFEYEISDGNIGYGYIEEDEFDILLHPLSDLTKPITHKGETFVPIEKLNELFGYEEIRLVHYINSGLGWNITSSPVNTAINFLDMYSPIQKLIEWHFDIANLIEKGKAIDVNTLDINPYK